MSPEEAKAAIDAAIANGALRRTDNREERQRLDELYAIAFADPDAGDRPYYLGADGRNVKVVGDNSAPTSTVYFPPEVAVIISHEDHSLKVNEARRVLYEVYNNPAHVYWKGDPAWVSALNVLTTIAGEE
jgi:hypothetical protein